MKAEDSEAVKFMHKAQSLRMNFWTPDSHSVWGKDLHPVDMPWYLLFDYVEVYRYNERTNQFMFDWRDDFNEFD